MMRWYPLCLACPPGLRPLGCWRLFGFLHPSEAGGLELLREFLFNCSRISAMICCCSAIV